MDSGISCAGRRAFNFLSLKDKKFRKMMKGKIKLFEETNANIGKSLIIYWVAFDLVIRRDIEYSYGGNEKERERDNFLRPLPKIREKIVER